MCCKQATAHPHPSFQIRCRMPEVKGPMTEGEVCPVHARRMAQEMNRLMDVARGWWLMKRPVSWDEKDHTFTPEVNCCTRAEENLAEVVADLIHDYPGKDGGE